MSAGHMQIVKTGGNSWLVAPQNMSEVFRFAEMLAQSSFVPKEMRGKPGDVLAAIQYGAELDIPPLQAVQGIAVINGRPSMWGDLLLGKLLSHPEIDDVIESFDKATMTATCIVLRTRPGKAQRATERSFSWEDAKTAKLTEKDTYKGYPKRMLQMRARGFAFRDAAADILRGIIVREEAQDIPAQGAAVVQTLGEAARLAAATPATNDAHDLAERVKAQNERIAAVHATFPKKFEFESGAWADKPMKAAPEHVIVAFIASCERVLKRADLTEDARVAIGQRKAHAEYHFEQIEQRQREAQAAGANPDTGEVAMMAPSDPIVDALQQHIDLKQQGIDSTDQNSDWGMENES